MSRAVGRCLTALLLLALPVGVTAAEAPADWVGQSRALTQQLGSELKAELSLALASGGPVAAIGVCRTRAPQIAARLSAQSGARVSRTALRVRNPASIPDALQRGVLERFAVELAAGPVDGPLEATLELRRGGQVERHYLRAIPMEPLCVTCHGRVLLPELAAAIGREYPLDQATGFEPGQLRGAFSVAWPAATATAAPASRR